LSLGLHRAGFDVLGVEMDAAAVETHRTQVGPCDHASLWDYSPAGAFELVAGGIPCQSHSTAGKRGGTCDPRGQLYVPFLRIAREARARAVMIENVRGILTSKSATHGTSIREVEAAFVSAGYPYLSRCVLDAVDYGVPQHRHRVFLVGFASAEDHARFRWPRATHSKHGGGLFGLRKWATVREALGLPRSDAASALDKPAPCVTATEERSANRFGSKGAKTGPRRCGDRLNPLLTELATAGLIDRPATTIDTTGRVSKAGHHKTNKDGAVRVTVDQLRALQAFPIGFEFTGTLKEQHRQVGNAVPPPLAEVVGRAILSALTG